MMPRNRRRSSHLALFVPAKAGIYGVQQRSMSPASPLSMLPPRPISFAPNVTPGTYFDSEDTSPATSAPGSPTTHPKLFPPSETPAPPPARKRCPPGKRRSQGYIPRPPNAFMLFRADFVRQKHVPGSIETNHGSLSKIIGNCWKQLPLDEKKVWEARARQEKAAHKVLYPNYRFRPVHNKNKKRAADAADAAKPPKADTRRPEASPEEEIRCEEVTQLLLEGKKGEDLAQAVRALDDRRRALQAARRKCSIQAPQPLSARGFAFASGIMSAPQPTYANTLLSPSSSNNQFFGDNASAGGFLHLRRSSSVPLPGLYNGGGFDVDMGFDAAMGTDFFLPPPPPYEEHASDKDGIALPTVPFLPPPTSAGISGMADSTAHLNFNGSAVAKHQQRMMLGHRRSSSAGAAFGGMQRAWATAFGGGAAGYGFGYFAGPDAQELVLQRDDEPLPDADLSLFDPNFFSGAASSTAPSEDLQAHSSGGSTLPTPCAPFAELALGPGQGMAPPLGPLDTSGFQQPAHRHTRSLSHGISPHELVTPTDAFWASDTAFSMAPPQQQQQQALGLQLGVGPTECAPTDGAGQGFAPYEMQGYAGAGDYDGGAPDAYMDAGGYGYGAMGMGIPMGMPAPYVAC